MKTFEAMIDLEKPGCEYCTPKGLTKSGTHHNIVKIVVEAETLTEAQAAFRQLGRPFSNIRDITNV